jgi:hypothetical protein
MALTYRQTKGSALTIQELDGNFEYFTGSHAVTGSLVSSGSIQATGSVSVSGSGLSPLTLFNVPNFASNQEALDAGLIAGMIYRSDDILCIVNND